MSFSAQGNNVEGVAATAASAPTPMPTPRRFFSIDSAPEYLFSPCLYERKAVTSLWIKLTTVAKQQWKWKNVSDKKSLELRSAPKRTLQVCGPPGSGKSSATYHWVESVCRTFRSNKPAIWINCAGDGECWTVQYDVGVSSVRAEERGVPLNDDDFGDAHTVVFDGVRKLTLERWRGQANRLARQGILVLIVSSGVLLHSGDSQDIIKLDHFVPSWLKSEYDEACQDDGFWNSIHLFVGDATHNDSVERRKELLDQKFHVAGHSARFMFKQNERSIVRELQQKAKSMGGIDALEKAVRSYCSDGAVNTLIARFQDEKEGPTPEQPAEMPSTEDYLAVATSMQELLRLEKEADPLGSSVSLVSAVATKEVIAKIPSTVERLRFVGKTLNNQAIIGYALEEQLKKRLVQAKQPGQQLAIRSSSGTSTLLQVSDVKFRDNSAQVEALLKARQASDTWIFVAGRQGAFDAIHIVSKTHIRFVQITAGKSHSFKLNVLDSLLSSLALSGVSWSHLEFLILRPEDDSRPFTLNPPQGTLQGYKRFDNELWHRPDYRDNVQYGTLDWD